MPTSGVMFAVHHHRADLELDRLERFLRLGTAEVEHHDDVTIGWLGIPPGTVTWGAPLPATLEDGLLTATDDALRAIEGITAAIAAGPGHVRLITAPSGPTVLYEARGDDGVTAWATHAVAAALLARGRATFDAGALPELVAFEFVGGERTLVEGVRAVPPATVIDLRGAAVERRSWWPPADRWRAVAEEDAHDHASASLVASLARRVGDGERTAVALTAGTDSRVVALALREAGLPFSAFTWGEPDWEDAVGARAVADALGVAHAVHRPRILGADALARALDEEARWTDGVHALSAARRTWPEGATKLVGGMGGETGRAFYWARHAAQAPPREATALAALLRASERLGPDAGDAVGAAEAAARGWVRDALATGVEGWRVLDVVYAEQRVRRWGRAQVAPLDADLLASFVPVEVARGLTSLPVATRAADGFHRRFVAERLPGLALRAPPRPAPAPSRRGRLRGRVAGLRGRPPGEPLPPWDGLPATVAFVGDDVLGSALVRDVFGDPWCERIIRGLLAGEPHATSQALQLCGPVALDAALRQ